jgi:hypothetical protein
MKKSKQNKHQQKQQRPSTVSHPPPFNSTISVSRRVRYVASTAFTSGSLTRADLLNHLICCTLATANARLLSGFKLNRIEIWSPGSSTFTTATSSVEWLSSYGPSKVVSDSSMTIEPAHIVSTPPPQSLASFWSLTGSNETETLCTLSYGANSIIDLSYEIIFQNGETPVVVTTAASNATGTVYMLPLFGIVSNSALPVSYANTF